MLVVTRAVEETRARLADHRRAGRSIGFVPTMGYLHGGHLSLIDAARSECDVAAVSIFVNPAQFGPGEDFERYPRDEARDLALCKQHGVDIVFAPDTRTLYADDATTRVQVGVVSRGLCGDARPGHFDGVATVVAILFNIVGPCRAYFGQKDFQQSRVIARMVRDLCFDVELRILPTVREADGLAMSSRNVYLSSEERANAPALYRALSAARRAFALGERDAAALQAAALGVLAGAPLLAVEYLRVVSADDAQPVAQAREGDVIAGAVRVGAARLIDNVVLESNPSCNAPC